MQWRLRTLAAKHSRYGYLLLNGLLKAEGLVVNQKRTYRLFTEGWAFPVHGLFSRARCEPAAVVTKVGYGLASKR